MGGFGLVLNMSNDIVLSDEEILGFLKNISCYVSEVYNNLKTVLSNLDTVIYWSNYIGSTSIKTLAKKWFNRVSIAIAGIIELSSIIQFTIRYYEKKVKEKSGDKNESKD